MARKPSTRNLYDMIGTNADLPIFSGEAPTVRAGTFDPQPVAAQESMFDLRPVMGKTEPTYTPKETEAIRQAESIISALDTRQSHRDTFMADAKPIARRRANQTLDKLINYGPDYLYRGKPLGIMTRREFVEFAVANGWKPRKSTIQGRRKPDLSGYYVTESWTFWHPTENTGYEGTDTEVKYYHHICTREAQE